MMSSKLGDSDRERSQTTMLSVDERGGLAVDGIGKQWGKKPSQPARITGAISDRTLLLMHG